MSDQSSKLKTFARLMLSYIMILIIPLILFSLSYLVIINNINADIMNVTKKQQNWGILMLEGKLQEMQKMAFQLSANPEIINFTKKIGNNPLELYETKSISRLLRNTVMMNNLLKNCYVYFPKSDTVVDQDSIFSYRDFYNHFFHYRNSNRHHWQQQYLNTFTEGRFIPKSKVFFGERATTGILYVKTIGTPHTIKGTIVMFIDNQEMSGLIGLISKEYNGWSYILNERKQIIATTREGNPVTWLYYGNSLGPAGIKRLKIKGKNYTAIYSKSGFSGWSYVDILDSNRVFWRSNRMAKAIFGLIIAVSGLGLLCVLWITFKRYKPIEAIFARIKEDYYDLPEVKKGDIYKVIEGGVNILYDQNKELKGVIEEQTGLLKVHFYESLIAGEYTSLDTLTDEAERIRITFTDGLYFICLVRIEAYQHLDSGLARNYEAMLDLVQNRLTAWLKNGEFLLRKSLGQFVLLLNTPTAATEQLKTRLTAIQKLLSELFTEDKRYFSSVAAGNPHESLLEISRSYHEACEVLAYKTLTPQYNLMLYSEVPVSQNVFYYPAELEFDLIRYVRTANTPIVGSILDRILDENLKKRNLPLPMLHHLQYELCGTALRLTEQINSGESKQSSQIKSEILDLLKKDDSVANLLLMKEIFAAICDEFAKHKKSHNLKLKESILAYLHQNYASSDLSLTKLAEVFNLNESYLSNFFKEQTGENYSDFLESLRIGKACKMLREQKFNVDYVAEIVGYTNHYTFRRAFKRVTGLSPSEYRKSS